MIRIIAPAVYSSTVSSYLAYLSTGQIHVGLFAWIGSTLVILGVAGVVKLMEKK